MDTVQWFKCLADATRLHITLLILKKEELCVCELVTALDYSQPKISRHLALLRRNNILFGRREGQWIYYALHPALPSWALTSLKTVEKVEMSRLKQMLHRLDKEQTKCVS